MNEILQIPNLLSLSRIALAPVIGYFVSVDDTESTLIALALLVLAGITDGLDGYLARRHHRVSKLGIALDPISDKVLAVWLVACLILFRDFPIWLAAVIVGRDLLILGFGALLIRGRSIALPSNITGKYAFTSIVLLLASYVIHFEFGIVLTTITTLVLVAASLGSYGRVFVRLRRNESLPDFQDRPGYRVVRSVLTTVISAVYLIRLYLDILR